ncbi:MAG: hypothetical protein DLM55_04275 [Acidimicrobiales bacterium]|nr:MAG: hypothetical protein DLM55_04275 [Acidimicrobiales bacterium]
MDVSATGLESGLRAMRTQQPRPPATLARRIIRDTRAQPRRGRLIPTQTGDPLAETEIAAVLRAVADQIPSVRARGCRVKPRRDSTGTPIAGPLEVELSIAVEYGSVIPAISIALPAALQTELAKRYGLRVGRLLLNVVDVVSKTSQKT